MATYVEHLLETDRVLDAALLEASEAAGLPPIDVTANQGKLLQLLARIQGARTDPRDRHARRLQHDLARPRAARRRPPRHAGGRPRSTPRSRAPTSRAPVSPRLVELRVGPALDTLPQLAAEGAGPFDLIFIDADKPTTPATSPGR